MQIKLIAAAVSLATLCVVTNGSSVSAQAPADNQPAQQPAQNVVVVQPGDNLSKIAEAKQTTYVRLYDANAEIQDPNVIHPGQNVRVPAADEQLASRPLPAAPAPAPAPAPAVQQKQPQAAKPRAAAQRAPAPAPAVSGDVGVWDRLARCESGGNWSINTGNGYYGGLQFSLSSWRAVGGSGLPSQASKAEQIARAQMLQARQGWGAWPACTAKLGIR